MATASRCLFARLTMTANQTHSTPSPSPGAWPLPFPGIADVFETRRLLPVLIHPPPNYDLELLVA
jgi:hypothetical protein